MPVLDEGLDTAAKRAEEAKNSGFHRVGFLKFEEDQTTCIRFVTPKTYTFGIHGGTPTKPKPAEFKGEKWPAQMFGICQQDVAFRLRDAAGEIIADAWDPGYGNCEIHNKMRGKKDPKYGGDLSNPRTQTFGLAVLREPVRDSGTGSITGFRNVLEEFKDKEGIVSQIPKLVIVQQTYSNFWAPLKASMYVGPSSLSAWDFAITRQEDNKYGFSQVATPDFAPGTEKWKLYDDTLALLELDLATQLIYWSSPDWYARWFVEGAVPEGGYGRQGDDSTSEDEAASGATPAEDMPTADQAAAYREKLRAGRS